MELPENERVLLMYHIVGVMDEPEIIEGETSSTGKTISVNKTTRSDENVRLDTETILSGGKETRDSRMYELYSKAGYRRIQQSNYAPGPRAGANHVTDPSDLPEPTHERPDDAKYNDPGVTK